MNREEIELTGLEIAIIGMACRFPGAKNIYEFWDNLKNGRSSITFFSDEELELAGVSKEIINDPNYVKAKGFLKDAEYFDADFFNYSESEARMLDPQTRLLHECAYEALENAGYDSERFNELIGLYVGALPNYFWENYFLSCVDDLAERADMIHLINKDFLNSRISHKLHLKGPSISVATACSTSLTAVHMASRALLTGECKMALAGGASILFPLKSGYLFKEGTMLSPDGFCRPFDAKAAGTCGGDGAGVVVLKLLEDAIADGDNICAVIKGSAVHNDGARKVGYTALSVEGVTDLVKIAHSFSRVEPKSVSYIETYGIGIPVGDAVEMEGLKQAFRTDEKECCGIGSIKPNIGYLGPADGIAGFIKVVLSLQHKLIPPTLNFETVNPLLDLENTPFYVNTKLKEWRNLEYPLRAGVSSFGVGGTNAHVILEEAPSIKREVKSRKWKLLLLSAKTGDSLEKATTKLVEYLKDNSEVSLADLAYTLQVGRKIFRNRRMVVCADNQDAVYKMASLHSQSSKTCALNKEKKTCIFIFPQQGAPYVKVGLELYEKEQIYKEAMDHCSEIVKSLLGYDLREIISGENDNLYNGKGEISDPIIAQTFMFTLEYALAKLLVSLGIMPDVIVGHGIGECVAACLCGIFSVEDALKVAILRGKLIKQQSLEEGLHLDVSEEMLKNIKFGVPSRAYISAQTGEWVDLKEVTSSAYWIKYLSGRINTTGTLGKLLEDKNSIFVEVGPEKNVETFFDQSVDEQSNYTIVNVLKHPKEEVEDTFYLLKAIGTLWCSGINIDWSKFSAGEKRYKVALPTYSFEHQHYKS